MLRRVKLTGLTSKKNAYSSVKKKPQAPTSNIVQTLNATPHKIPVLDFSFRALCGCLTWKHERNTDDCYPIAEQELAENLGFVDIASDEWNDQTLKDLRAVCDRAVDVDVAIRSRGARRPLRKEGRLGGVKGGHFCDGCEL